MCFAVFIKKFAYRHDIFPKCKESQTDANHFGSQRFFGSKNGSKTGFVQLSVINPPSVEYEMLPLLAPFVMFLFRGTLETPGKATAFLHHS